MSYCSVLRFLPLATSIATFASIGLSQDASATEIRFEPTTAIVRPDANSGNKFKFDVYIDVPAGETVSQIILNIQYDVTEMFLEGGASGTVTSQFFPPVVGPATRRVTTYLFNPSNPRLDASGAQSDFTINGSQGTPATVLTGPNGTPVPLVRVLQTVDVAPALVAGGGGEDCDTFGRCQCVLVVQGDPMPEGVPEPQPDSCGPCPIIIDTANNGISLTSKADGIDFDYVGNGNKIKTAWTRMNSDDAFLVFDRNRNGVIDSGRELFGNYTPQTPSETPNGYIALAEFDKPAFGGNSDGEISVQDSVYSQLRLWKDLNHNGVSEASELFTLPALSVRRIKLNYRRSRRVDEFNNEFRYRSRVFDGAGTNIGKWSWDVYFDTDFTMP